MKKSLLFAFIACAVLSPLAVSAQKKSTVKQPVPLTLKTEADSISYALGASIAGTGLTPYLAQMGVLADTAALVADYRTKMDNAVDATAKNKLMKEMAFKLDSVSKANVKSIDLFLSGFNQAMNDTKDNTAFNTGIAIGGQMASMKERFAEEVLAGSEFNTKAFAEAFAKSLKKENLLIEDHEQLIQNATMKAQEKAQQKKADEMRAEYKEQIEAGDKFMADNRLKEGVVTLPSGLQYQVITMGTGEMPTDEDRVVVHYEGKLLDGTVFDSSIERGEPATFGVTQVIKGWTEALKLMPVGSKWILYIPHELAYGSRDQGEIKPFSNLIFEVELLDIVKED
ncbi:FKBP-type peptidyl-prolyl cis-trans isomerase [Dysgonomonas sp. 511]|uniref:FKBP-type peptidyl-prolyl cis-trans isomerase n=1 Tax=Dysgonomonas sp. 511 TaxID=2302930 RepID=UPI0013D5A2E7|nr:FKBP-type peptidyl-prolyl cis-trans isomerase [Dysgonomonas sp. 511]NDV78033.1 FKBP-type peptidyl-prolyl cis-trans isomerase [Dysgonomonas sp. 511]